MVLFSTLTLFYKNQNPPPANIEMNLTFLVFLPPFSDVRLLVKMNNKILHLSFVAKRRSSPVVTLLILFPETGRLTNLDPPRLFARPKEDSGGIQDPQAQPANVQRRRTKAFFTSDITTKTQRQYIWQSATAAGAALAGDPWPSTAAGLTGGRERAGWGVLLYLPYS